MPGRNCQSLLMVQFSSMRREPTMMATKQSQQMFMRCPRVNSQNIAKIMPPDPFQPKQRLSTMPAKPTKHDTLSLLSRGVSGKYGQSSYLRMTPMQLMRKAVRMVTKAYCSMGIRKKSAMRVWRTTKTGAKMTRRRLLKLMSGSEVVSLQEQSSERLAVSVGRGVSIDLSSSLSRNVYFNSGRLIVLINYTDEVTEGHGKGTTWDKSKQVIIKKGRQLVKVELSTAS